MLIKRFVADFTFYDWSLEKHAVSILVVRKACSVYTGRSKSMQCLYWSLEKHAVSVLVVRKACSVCTGR